MSNNKNILDKIDKYNNNKEINKNEEKYFYNKKIDNYKKFNIYKNYNSFSDLFNNGKKSSQEELLDFYSDLKKYGIDYASLRHPSITRKMFQFSFTYGEEIFEDDEDKNIKITAEDIIKYAMSKSEKSSKIRIA